MLLDRISLTDFKNIPSATLDFSPRLNGLLGCNGMGKSNLLDAIYALSFTKSFTGVQDSRLVRRGQPLFFIEGRYTRLGLPETVTLGLAAGSRKQLKRKGKEYRRMADHIGAFPLVMMSPRDVDLVRGSGTDRRRWIDMVISQSHAPYLDALIRYGAALEQRNRLLRDGITDRAYFEVLDMTLDSTAAIIHRERSSNVLRLDEIFRGYYALLGGEGETPSLQYESALSEPGVTMAALLDANAARDCALRHTSAGTHRDDIIMTLDDMPVKACASEGQCKTFTIALRLAQYEYLREATGLKPLLLLDDIFDKLDSRRVEKLVRLVTSGDSFGQIFITDTNRTHLDEIFGAVGGDINLWSVTDGAFTPLTLTT